MAPVDDDDEESADGWRDLMHGKIRKRILVHGAGEPPEMKADIICSWQVRLAVGTDNYRPEVLQRYDHVRYRVGEGEAIPCLELALRNMRPGEEADVFGAPNFAFSNVGCPAVNEFEEEVPPETPVMLHVTLHEILEEHGEPSWNDRIQEVTWRKINGNAHFKRKHFAKAQKAYQAGMEVFNDGFEPPDHIHNRESATAVAMQLVTDCAANIAAVHLERGDNVAAKEACTQALLMSPKHVKALYRGAKAALALDDFEECELAINQALEIEPGNTSAKRLLEDLRRKRSKYAAKSKGVGKLMFEGLEYPDEPPKASSKKEPVEPPGWLQWFKEDFLDEMLALVDWKFVAGGVLCILACILVAYFVPAPYTPIALISIVLGFPITLAVVSVQRMEAEEAKKQA